MNISQLASYIHPYTLSDKGIKELLESGELIINPKVSDDQIQPATLDVRVGRVKVYDRSSWAKGAIMMPDLKDDFEAFNYEPTDKYATVFEDEKDIPILLPSGCFVEMDFHENLIFDPNKYYFTSELRSSRGRFSLESMNELFPNWKNKIDFWNNNPNDIILYGQSKFAQLFFHPRYESTPRNGRVVNNPEEVRKIAKTVCEGAITVGNYIVFKAGEKAFSFKKLGRPLDTNNMPEHDELYETHNLNKPTIISEREPYVVQLDPEVKLPSNIGIRLLHTIPRAQIYPEMQQGFALDQSLVNAGWVDPGYEGKITAHPFRRLTPRILKRNDVVAYGIFYKYEEGVERNYGSKELGSHYQGSDGATSRS